MLKSIQLREKLFLSYGLMALISVGIGVICYFSLLILVDDIMEIGKNRLPGVQSLLIINGAQTQVTAGERGLLIEWLKDPEQRKKNYKDIDDAFQEADKAWKRYESLPQTKEEERLWKEFIPIWEKWKNHVIKVVDAAKERDNLAASGLEVNDPKLVDAEDRVVQASRGLAAEASDVDARINQLIDINAAEGDEKVKDGLRHASRVKITLLLTGVLGILLAAGMGFFMSKRITEPIKKCVAFAGAIESGNLSGRIQIESKDEIGRLGQSLNAMTVSLEKNQNELIKNAEAMELLLSKVAVAAEQIANGASQLSDSSQSLSEGATQQASSIEEICSSLMEISSQTKANSEYASKAEQTAKQSRELAETGAKEMTSLITAMDAINGASQSIAKIIKVIDEIAFQTNLLSLNAAVEAARAGRHGKGFAVVAGEVRNLAGRSAKAAKETAELIEGSIKKVETGNKITRQTSEALNKIVESTMKAAVLIGEISAASNEQYQGIEQVNQGIAQVDQVTQQNTANAEQTASTAEELAGQALQLQQLLTQYQSKEIEQKIPDKAYDKAHKFVNRPIRKKTDIIIHPLVKKAFKKPEGIEISSTDNTKKLTEIEYQFSNDEDDKELKSF